MLHYRAGQLPHAEAAHAGRPHHTQQRPARSEWLGASALPRVGPAGQCWPAGEMPGKRQHLLPWTDARICTRICTRAIFPQPLPQRRGHSSLHEINAAAEGKSNFDMAAPTITSSRAPNKHQAPGNAPQWRLSQPRLQRCVPQGAPGARATPTCSRTLATLPAASPRPARQRPPPSYLTKR
jgi:hypothetical protein